MVEKAVDRVELKNRIDGESVRVREEFRDALRRMLSDTDTSQAELARRYGASRGWINNMLRDAPNMTIRLMVALAYLLGYRVSLRLDPLDKENR